MNLNVPYEDGRRLSQFGSSTLSITDTETGKTVGSITVGHGGEPRRSVYLFDHKYNGAFDTHAECYAFVKGVEAVLNRMVSTGYPVAGPSEVKIVA